MSPSGPFSPAWANLVGDIEIADFNFQTLDGALDFTIQTMKELAVMRRSDPRIRMIGGQLARLCKPRDQWCQAGVLLQWVRQNIHFLADPGHELIQDAIVTLQLGIGDCDDLSVLFCAVAESMGFHTAYVTGAGQASGQPRHVLPALQFGPEWIPAEVCHLTLPLGEYPDGFYIHQIYPLPI